MKLFPVDRGAKLRRMMAQVLNTRHLVSLLLLRCVGGTFASRPHALETTLSLGGALFSSQNHSGVGFLFRFPNGRAAIRNCHAVRRGRSRPPSLPRLGAVADGGPPSLWRPARLVAEPWWRLGRLAARTGCDASGHDGS